MWTGGGLEDSGSNPPTYSSGEGYGFKKKQSQGKNTSNSGDADVYDFEVEDGSDIESGDLDASDDVYVPTMKKETKTSNRPGSADVRGRGTGTKGDSSLAINKPNTKVATASVGSDDDEEEEGQGGDTWKASWNELMKGVHSPSDVDKSGSLSEASPPTARGGRYANSPLSGGKGRIDIDRSIDSNNSRDDSMEISASDFQVGVDAARRAKEKTTQRQRRQALEVAPHIARERDMASQQRSSGHGLTQNNPPKVAASPDVKQRQGGYNDRDRDRGGQQSGVGGSSFKIGVSAALSSIGANRSLESDDSAPFRYGGSVEKSDGDLYQMLGGGGSTAASAEGAKIGMGGRYYDISQDSSNRHVSDFSSDHGSGSRDEYKHKGLGGNNSNSDDDSNDDEDSGDSELAQSSEMPTGKHSSVSGTGPKRSGFSGPTDSVDPLGGSKSVSSYKESQANKSDKKASSPEGSDYDTDDFEDAVPSGKNYSALRADDEAAKNMERIRARWLNPGASTDIVSSFTTSIDTNAHDAKLTVATVATAAPGTATTTTTTTTVHKKSDDDDGDTSFHSGATDEDEVDDNNESEEKRDRERQEREEELDLKLDREERERNAAAAAAATCARTIASTNEIDLQYADADPANAVFPKPTATTSSDSMILPGTRLLTAVGSASMVTSVPPPPPPLMSESAEMMLTVADTGGDQRQNNQSSSRATAFTYSEDSDGMSQKPLTPASTSAAGTGTINKARYVDQDDSTSPQPSFTQQQLKMDTSSAKAAHVNYSSGASATATVNVARNNHNNNSVYSSLESFAAPPPQPVVISHNLAEGDDRDSLSAADGSGYNTFGQRTLASRGQALLNTIVAVEIDPAVLGIDVTASQTRPPTGRSKQTGTGTNTSLLRQSKENSTPAAGSSSRNSSKVRKAPPNPPTAWPQDLPMAGSDTGALHAKLALMESAETKRISAIKIQAQKIREIRHINATVKGGKKSSSSIARNIHSNSNITNAAFTTSKSPSNAISTGAVPPAMSRLEAGTARLARQFDRMEKELKNVRESQASQGGNIEPHLGSMGSASSSTCTKSILGSTPSRGTHSSSSRGMKGDSPSSIPVPSSLVSAYPPTDFGALGKSSNSCSAGVTAAQQNSDDADQSSRLGLSTTISHNNNQGSSNNGNKGGSYDDGTSIWETEVLTTMKRIVAEGDKIQEKERALAVREEALRIRESVMEMEYRNPNRSGGNISSNGVNTNDPAAVAEASREAVLKTEIETLKARLFEATNNKEKDPNTDKNEDADAAVNRSLPLPAHANKSKYTGGTGTGTGAGTSQDATDTGTGIAEEGNMTITKAKYNAMKSELASQEILLEGFQKENEKLVLQLKEATLKERSYKARYFDERENLNKDLNRLRNVTGESLDMQMSGYEGGGGGTLGGGSHIRRSAADFREELNKDSVIFSLKERLGEAESRMGHREKELQKTIDRLRTDNQSLTRANATANKNAMQGHMDILKSKEAEVSALNEQNTGLRSKLEWYAETQVLLETVERDKKDLSSQVMVLKKELRKKGMERGVLQALCAAAGTGTGTESARSTPSKGDDSSDEDTLRDISSSTSPTKSGSSRGGGNRSLSDVKKIKELENTVYDLQESLRKRNPDSVNNLVRAAAMSDEMQEERRIAETEIENAKNELKEAREDYDMRLRSLRQEHEKVKSQYEKRIEVLQYSQPTTTTATPIKGGSSTSSFTGTGTGTGTGSGKSTPSPTSEHGSKSSGSPKTLVAAQARVRELESEIERIRVFYTKKVDEEKRKSEAQLASLKRGVGSSSAATGDALSYGVNTSSQHGTSGAATGQDAPVIVTENTALGGGAGASIMSSVSVSDQIQNALAALRSEYDTKLAITTAQLTASQEELKRLQELEKARLLEAGVTRANVPPSVSEIRNSSAFTEEVNREVTVRMSSANTTTTTSSSDIQHAVRMAEQKGEIEIEGLKMKVREEEHKSQLMKGELESLRAQIVHTQQALSQAQAQAQSGGHQQQQQQPQIALATLQNLETQITSLELRLQRREGELASAIEEGRTLSKLERSRLQAIHACELREKDEALVKFQTELETLIYSLRQWQTVAYEAQQQRNNNDTAAAGGGAGGGIPPPPHVALFGLSH